MAFAARFPALFAGVLLLWAGQPLSAQEQADPNVTSERTTVTPPPVSSPFSGGGTVSLLGYVLTIVVLGAAGFTVLLRGGYFGVSWGAAKAVRKLRIEESRTVGNRQHLVVAEYEGRRVLLGISPARIDYLCGLDGDGGAPAGTFSEALSDATVGEQTQSKGDQKAEPLKEGK
jgi:flagellar protein FliO/FliZ